VFEDRDVSIRARTIEAMVRIDIGSRSTQGVLEKAIKDANPKIRRQAIMSLEQIGAAAVPLLLEAMKDPDFSVRACAATALGRIGPGAKEAIGVLTEALTDRNVRGYAKIALERIQNDPR
jgi:HEAT repeat protein